MGRLVLLLLLLAPVACTKEAMPKLSGDCTAAADCAITHLDEACCSRCFWVTGTQASVAARVSYCAAHENPKCAVYDCPPADPTVACVKGRCVLTALE